MAAQHHPFLDSPSSHQIIALRIDGSASLPLDLLLTTNRRNRRSSVKSINAGGLIHHDLVEAPRAGIIDKDDEKASSIAIIEAALIKLRNDIAIAFRVFSLDKRNLNSKTFKFFDAVEEHYKCFSRFSDKKQRAILFLWWDDKPKKR
ncbi:hypothetical protein P3X46_012160 [Hevea brasiliensis]|uniref:Uncharacterized protein n=1 Tax=Hevea brasiliensis TaxID=3981 RepID=A0ABQ9MBI3_HEVBR|nr:5'-adenylylsulfate reductase 3, chloroplastic [Hevea brasiliensis]KAJ9176895.1 hypothetical protein P3X46_012160 [Hevea brasiliensis]